MSGQMVLDGQHLMMETLMNSILVVASAVLMFKTSQLWSPRVQPDRDERTKKDGVIDASDVMSRTDLIQNPVLLMTQLHHRLVLHFMFLSSPTSPAVLQHKNQSRRKFRF